MEIKDSIDWSFGKKITCETLVHVIVGVLKLVKLMNI